MQVVQYNHPSYKRDPNHMDWVDTVLNAKMGRINVNADTSFIATMLVRENLSSLSQDPSLLPSLFPLSSLSLPFSLFD